MPERLRNFPKAKRITWDDIIYKMSQEMPNGTHNMLARNVNDSLTINLISNVGLTKSISDAYKEIRKATNTPTMHMFVSFAKNAHSWGRHKDDMDVLLVQAIGETSYKFDDGEVVKLSPGNSLFIPAGEYHDPIVTGPRVTLSLSWGGNGSRRY